MTEPAEGPAGAPVPQPPTGEPAGTVWFGGPIPWFSVSVSITADDLDPGDVSRLLGVEPDQAQRRGVPLRARHNRPGRVPRFGSWSISLRRDQTAEWDVELAIGKLLDRVAAPADAWRKALDGAKGRIFVGLSLDTCNRGFSVGPALSRRVADLGLRLDFDIYVEARVDEVEADA